MLATQQLVAFLEDRFYSQPASPAQIIQLAEQSAEFSLAWLVHCIGSEVQSTELSKALSLAASHKPEILQEIAEFIGDSQQRLSVEMLVEQLMAMQNVQLPPWFDQIRWHHQLVPMQCCQQLIAQRQRLLEPAAVYADDQVDSMKRHVRDCSQSIAHLHQRSLQTSLLERRMAYQAQMPIALAEPLVILSYQPGQKFDWHYDFIDPNNQAAMQELEFFGQRIFTSILYLNDDFREGHTLFRQWQIDCKPLSGSMLSFFNVDSMQGPALGAEHKGAPPEAGVKWVATQWFRQKPLWTRKGLFV